MPTLCSSAIHVLRFVVLVLSSLACHFEEFAIARVPACGPGPTQLAAFPLCSELLRESSIDRMDRVTLLGLPDDALLRVLAYLPLRELFVCRQVCRRFRSLCLHPDLWRYVWLPQSLVRAALSLAPCLAGFVGCLGDGLPMKEVAAAVAGTACVVDDLRLTLVEQEDVPLAEDVIRQLAAVGGVRILYLHTGCTTRTASIIEVVYSLDNLQELVIEAGAPLPAACNNVKVRSHLTRLEYVRKTHAPAIPADTLDPFFLQLVATHASTLEHVYVDFPFEVVVPMSLLAGIRGLRQLTCSLNEGMPQLLSLPDLVSVDFWSCDGGDLAPPGALDFLRQSSQLRTARLPDDDTAALVALSESRSAGVLTSLSFRGACVDDDAPLLTSLAAVLPRFPSLAELQMFAEPSADLLRAISPTSAPHLTRLTVLAPSDRCRHAWLHEPGIQDLLRRNSSLHLCVQFSLHGGDPKDCDCSWCLCKCGWCSWGCHSDLYSGGFRKFASHARGAGCSVNCYQV
ncbi:uncharacterized protein LOC117647317 isoform X2 [Thrips palmi]|uniref:Uncharacterized protein LOC117647317 isoform X2 n=1 Tax=Thrips palmi TaxID=161013 RepID=A0A6P8Z4A0_THRPL|nr:uncharacterized protein LOC117647317 isoform X2 [Thrips palmi]